MISCLGFNCLRHKYNSKGRSRPTCSTHCLKVYWQTGAFGDTSPLQDVPGNRLSFLHGQQRGWWGAGWSLVFPVGEATTLLGCSLRSCETNQPPLESNLEVFAGGLKFGLSVTGDSHSSSPIYQPEVWFGECQQVGICVSLE